MHSNASKIATRNLASAPAGRNLLNVLGSDQV